MNKETMQLIIEAKPNNESFARAVIGAFAARLSPTLEQLSDIQTAVSESVTNSVVHAYANSSEKNIIDITAAVDEDTLTISISDFGCGIEDIEKAKQPFFSTRAHLERSGMGFTIMEAFMDEVDIMSDVGSGTTIIMKKQIVHPVANNTNEES